MIDRNADIRADLSQFYSLKAVLEDVLGRSSFALLKETGTLPKWKAEAKRLLKAIELAISTTVEIADDEWHGEVKQIVEFGRVEVLECDSVAELFATLSATLTRLVFTQIGYLPRALVDRRSLTPSNWKLDPVRTVQYVQSPRQKEVALQLRRKRYQAIASEAT